jgi:hypothetical protein
MTEEVLWVWNGWGVLLTCVVGLTVFGHILVSVKLRQFAWLRRVLPAVGVAAVILVFPLSGWAAGLLALPVGMTIGVVLARMLIGRPT